MEYDQREVEKSLIRLLAVCSRHNTFNAVATEMNAHQSTVARRVAVLEGRLGYKVINRTSEGYTLTGAGRKLAPKAREIEKMLFSFERDAALLGEGQINTVTVQASEGLGTHWVSPLCTGRSELRGVSINLICSDILPDLGTSTIDMSIQYAPASDDNYSQTILGYLQVMPYASPDYIAEHEAPQNVADLSNHQIIAQIGPHDSKDIWYETLDADVMAALEPKIALYTNSGSAQYYAIKASLGIGGLPTYGVSKDANLVPVEIGVFQQIPIYLVYQKDRIRDQATFNKALRWVKQIFDGDKYSFFKDNRLD